MLLRKLPCVTSPSAAVATAISALWTIMPAGDAAAQVTCNLPQAVGGGITETPPGVPARSDAPAGVAGIGWGVGDGQCNGSFVVTEDALFPSPDGDGIELGMRAEQRSVGQIDPVGADYTVETGSDPTNPARAWWNFQHSISYGGNINDLDDLTFAIRTDEGLSTPFLPRYDMLALRSTIDDRNPTADRGDPAENRTQTYRDLYQTSQNPIFFPWFSSYDPDDEGAWTMTLAALEDGAIATVQICIHTANAECAEDTPAVYTCEGFGPPLDEPLSFKKANRTLPLKMVCRDGAGALLTDEDIAAPAVVVTADGGGDATSDGQLLNAGVGDGTRFEFRGGTWRYNLSTRNFDAPGTFEITVQGTGGDVLLGAPAQTVVIGD
jgi:hypothetical protein